MRTTVRSIRCSLREADQSFSAKPRIIGSSAVIGGHIVLVRMTKKGGMRTSDNKRLYVLTLDVDVPVMINDIAVSLNGTRTTGSLGIKTKELMFEGKQMNSADVSDVFQQQFLSYESYARWVIDQHLSIAVWPKEHVIQDMHLDFNDAKIVPLRKVNCRIAEIKDFVPDESTPLDCFIVEGLTVFLDSIYAVGLSRS